MLLICCCFDQSELQDKLNILERKTEKNQLVITQMREQQAKLKVRERERKNIVYSLLHQWCVISGCSLFDKQS